MTPYVPVANERVVVASEMECSLDEPDKRVLPAGSG